MNDKQSVSHGGRVRKTPSTKIHTITLDVGTSILIDPSGKKLRIAEIEPNQITFEEEEMDAAEMG